MDWIKTLVKHVVAVGVALGVAFLVIQWFGIESEWAMGTIGLLIVALEKLVRAHPSIPVTDYVND
jgi:hypothetical protein